MELIDKSSQKKRPTLYDMRHPYCSFMEDTCKRNLLKPVHGMLLRASNGSPEVRIDFKILPKRVLGKEYYFNVIQYEQRGPEMISTIAFKDLNKMSRVRNHFSSILGFIWNILLLEMDYCNNMYADYSISAFLLGRQA